LSGGNICVPSIIGPIDCASPDDIQEIRDQKPTNIFVEFGDNKWTFAGIDLAKDSPPPIEPPPKTEHRQIGELEEQPTTLVGGFGQNSRDRFSKFRTPKSFILFFEFFYCYFIQLSFQPSMSMPTIHSQMIAKVLLP
jgi:hypothetical protein